MLTINTDDDPLFRDYHQAGKEKRMVVILPEGAYGEWLTASAEQSREFLMPFPSDKLVAKAPFVRAGVYRALASGRV